MRSSWSEPQSVPGLVFADYIELLHLWLQGIYQSDFGTNRLCCPCVESSFVLLEEGVCYDQCVLLAKLCEPLTCLGLYSKANLPVIPGVS